MNEHNWTDELTDRERAQVRHATLYSTGCADAGVPGHGQFMLIAKLVEMLDRYYRYIPETPKVQKIAWSEDSQCWRDIYTGVKVEL